MSDQKVLVVDDDRGILQLITAMLRRGGYEVLAVSSGHEALASYATEQPDIVLLDLLMPEMNGVEVLKAMRAYDAEHDRRTVILMLTAHTQNSYPFDLPQNSAAPDGWITKPVTSAGLLQELAAYGKPG